jgi:predicted ArsR family transcriptional regulator
VAKYKHNEIGQHMSERQSILNCLKFNGELTAIEAAEHTGLTSMGARGHLERLELSGLVTFREVKEGRGRPKRYWSLTSNGHQQFPQQYDHLSIEMIENVKDLFGSEGLAKLINAREDKALGKYQAAVAQHDTATEKLEALARERTKEGYMAEVIATDKNEWQLVEHHCPICAAAETCQGFCESELTVFQKSLGDSFQVTRTEHLLSDGQRCRYKIEKKD